MSTYERASVKARLLNSFRINVKGEVQTRYKYALTGLSPEQKEKYISAVANEYFNPEQQGNLVFNSNNAIGAGTVNAELTFKTDAEGNIRVNLVKDNSEADVAINMAENMVSTANSSAMKQALINAFAQQIAMQTFAGKTASAPAAAPAQVVQETAIEAEDTLDI
jgi:hypothetical protein